MSKKLEEDYFHISKKGEKSACSASKRDCPLLKEGTFHGTDEQVTKEINRRLRKEHTLFNNIAENRTIRGNMSRYIKDPELIEALTNEKMVQLLAKRTELVDKLEELKARRERPRPFHLINRMVKVSDELGCVKADIEAIKDRNVEIVTRNFPEPTEHELKLTGFEEIATEESGSREWLRARQSTLGGSDVGKMVYVDGERGYRQVKSSKLDLELEDQEHSSHALRGDLWEPALVSLAASKLGEPVYINKSTFREKDGSRHVNVDGFTVNEDGSIKAIVECKTSTFPEHWKNGKIPPEYVLQVQHYMDCAGVSEGYIAVNIDDTEFKLVKVTPETKISPEKGKREREKLGIPKRFTYSDVKSTAVAKNDELSELRKIKAEGKRYKKPTVSRKWKEEWVPALNNPAGLAFMDIETSHLSEEKGHILEIAIEKVNRKTGKVEKFHRFYGVPQKHELWNGTGPSDVHNIHPSDVRGLKPLREDKEAQRELRDFLTDPKTGKMATGVAHNKQFEKSWLAAAAGINDLEFADTMTAYSALGSEDRLNNKLESLVTEAGMEYKNAHRADVDTKMMLDAYMKYLRPRIKKALS